MKMFKELNEKIFYLDDYLKIWNLLVKKIREFHKKNNYFAVACEEKNTGMYNLFMINDKIDIINNLKYNSLAIFDSEIKARTEALALLSHYVRLIKEYLSLYVIDGYSSFDDNSLCGGIISLNDSFIKGLEIKIKKRNDKYIVECFYSHKILQVINEYVQSYNIINSIISPHKYGEVILEKNDLLSKNLVVELDKKYEILHTEDNLTAKEKFVFLEKMGCNYIFEIRKNGKLKVKLVYQNKEEEITLADLDSFILKNDSLINQELYRESFSNSLNFLKNHQVYMCKECLKNHQEFFIKPFNQRVKNHCCMACNKEAEIILIRL